MNYKPRVVIYNNSWLGVAVGTKMDPNYIVVNLLLPQQQEHVVAHKSHLFYTSLTTPDIRHITSFGEFQQTYPEYFI